MDKLTQLKEVIKTNNRFSNKTIVSIILISILILTIVSYPLIRNKLDLIAIRQELNEYLKEGVKADRNINFMISKVNEKYNNNITYPKEVMASDLKVLEVMKETLTTSQVNFKDLEYSYIKSIDILEKMINNLSNDKHVYFGMKDVEKTLAKNREEKLEKMIELLEKYEVKYELNDGAISYSIGRF